MRILTHPDKKKIEELKNRAEQFKAVISRLESKGKQVRFLLPNHNGFDFNDVLKQEGYVALSQQLNEIITEKDHQKITDNYIEKTEKGIDLDMEKMIYNYKKQDDRIKNIVDIVPVIPKDNTKLNSNIDQIIRQTNKDLSQHDHSLSVVKNNLDNKIIDQLKSSKIKDTSSIKPTKIVENQKVFER